MGTIQERKRLRATAKRLREQAKDHRQRGELVDAKRKEERAKVIESQVRQ